MYALQDYIGEENLNRAIRAFRDEWRVQGPAVSERVAICSRTSARSRRRICST